MATFNTEIYLLLLFNFRTFVARNNNTTYFPSIHVAHLSRETQWYHCEGCSTRFNDITKNPSRVISERAICERVVCGSWWKPARNFNISERSRGRIIYIEVRPINLKKIYGISREPNKHVYNDSPVTVKRDVKITLAGIRSRGYNTFGLRIWRFAHLIRKVGWKWQTILHHATRCSW